MRALLAAHGLGREGIIFTQFRATQDAIVDGARGRGHPSPVFHGELGWREKEEALERFRGPIPVLVSTEAGGEGRNLQFAASSSTTTCRGTRCASSSASAACTGSGRTHPVRVVNLVARGTIEAYVLEILERKIRMFELVVGEMEEILGAWQPHGSFEDEVFKIWVESKDEEQRSKKYADFAARLAAARKRYVEEQELQKALLPEERS